MADSKKKYTDFDNFVKTVKEEIRKNKYYKLKYKTLSQNSKRITVEKYNENITFELFIVRYNKGTDTTELKFAFEDTEYKIYYKESKYAIYLNNRLVPIDSKSLKYVIDTELQNQRKINQSKVFPYSIIIETLNDNKPVYPYMTNFTCPECHSQKIVINQENDLRIENYTNYNKKLHDENPDCYPEFCKAAFSGYLYCKTCKEFIAVLGEYSYEEGVVNEIDGYGDLLHVDEYKIKYMDRMEDFINLDYLKYQDLRSLLRESFHLYFVDEESCANKIRAFLDLYLTKLGVAETLLDGGFYPLANRIRDCKRITKDQKKILCALKNFGNEGSHGDGKITKTDLSNAYKVLEEILHKESNKKNVEKLIKKFGKKK